jgi:hypothetical protein
MSDLVPRDDRNARNYTSRETLVRQGLVAAGCLAAALVLAVVRSLPLAAGVIAGGIITLFGVGSLRSKETENKRTGALLCVTGVLVLLSRSPFLPGFSGGILSLGVFGLLALGVWNGVKFLLGLKARR